MADLQHILRSIPDLSREEMLTLRSVLDDELRSASGAPHAPTQPSGLVGLFAHDDDVLDRVMEAVWESRSRPLRSE